MHNCCKPVNKLNSSVSYGPLAKVTSRIVVCFIYSCTPGHVPSGYSGYSAVWWHLRTTRRSKDDDPILPALEYPILPVIDMVYTNCYTLITAHSHEKLLLYAETLIN